MLIEGKKFILFFSHRHTRLIHTYTNTHIYFRATVPQSTTQATMQAKREKEKSGNNMNLLKGK